jgi:hypothetical protein
MVTYIDILERINDFNMCLWVNLLYEFKDCKV